MDQPYAENHALPPGTKVFSNLSYVSNGHVRQKLDIYVPASPQGPLMVWIHGGGWISKTKDHPEGLWLLTQGYCVVSLDYRYSSDAIFPAQIEDCKAAIRWLRAHAAEYGYDPRKVAAMGGSAGGHLVALLATTGNMRDFDRGENLDQSSSIQCGVDNYGPADFPQWKPVCNDPEIQRSGADSIVVKLLGGSIDERMEWARKASPVFWVSKDSAPLYIQHGTRDALVGREQSQELADKLKSAEVEVILDIIEGGEHGGPEYWTSDRIHRITEFVKQHLGPL